MDQTADEHASMASILNPLERYGGLQKITEKPTLVAAVGSVIISLMSILIRKTMPLSRRLRVMCDALFQSCIFGVDSTKTMLSKLYHKYFFNEQGSVYSPWKVLRAIDLCRGDFEISGLLQYTIAFHHLMNQHLIGLLCKR